MFRSIVPAVADRGGMRMRQAIVGGQSGTGVRMFTAGAPGVPLTAATLGGGVPRPGALGWFLTDGADSIFLGNAEDGAQDAPVLWLSRTTAQSISGGGGEEKVLFSAAPSTPMDALSPWLADPWAMWGDRAVVNGGCNTTVYGWAGATYSTARATGGAGSATRSWGGGQVVVEVRGLVPEQVYTAAVDVYATGAHVHMQVLADGAPVASTAGAGYAATTSLGVWQRLSFTFAARRGQQRLSFTSPTGTGSDAAWFDGAAVAAGASAPAFSADDLDGLYAPVDGLYQVGYSGTWSYSGDVWRSVYIRRASDAGLVSRWSGTMPTTQLAFTGSETVWLEGGDRLYMNAANGYGSAVNLNFAKMSLRWIGH